MARPLPGETGPSQDRDMHYKLHSTKGGQIPSVRCKACLDNPPIRFNASIVKEIERLVEESGIWTLEETMGCGNDDCENHHRPVASTPTCTGGVASRNPAWASFDGRVDPFEINSQAARSGELKLAEPFREYAQYWLAGDELGGNRAIFRAVNNFVFVGEDGATLAMRLDFARQPLDFEDILWPGQRVPRPKRVRRRGKRLLQPELLKRLRTEGATIPCQDTSLLVYCPFRRDDKLELPWLNT